ncbi:hypothetical protein M3Y99_01829500 [Aphelenchoides fujianensis]|nr:hypothetical protein M3Y99_01829500 [Aphelenchoides fujianensis]
MTKMRLMLVLLVCAVLPLVLRGAPLTRSAATPPATNETAADGSLELGQAAGNKTDLWYGQPRREFNITRFHKEETANNERMTLLAYGFLILYFVAAGFQHAHCCSGLCGCCEKKEPADGAS